jgi:hypothetical protein
MMFLRNFVHANQRNWPSLLPQQAELALANRFVAERLGPHAVLSAARNPEFRARATAEFKDQQGVMTNAGPFAEAAGDGGATGSGPRPAAGGAGAPCGSLAERGTPSPLRLRHVGDGSQRGAAGNPDSRVQDCRKMGHRRSGPFQVKAVRGNNAYEVQLHARSRAHNVIDIEHLRTFDEGREPTGPAALPDMGDGDMFLVQRGVGSPVFLQPVLPVPGQLGRLDGAQAQLVAAAVGTGLKGFPVHGLRGVCANPTGCGQGFCVSRTTTEWSGLRRAGAAATTTPALPLQVLSTTIHTDEHQLVMRRYTGVTLSVRQRADEMAAGFHRG